MILFGLTIVLCLHGAINSNVVDENFQIVYPQQLRKAKVLEDLPLDGSFEVEMRDEELSAIITEPLDQEVDVLKKETTLDVVDDEDNDKKSKSLIGVFPFNESHKGDQHHEHGHDEEHHHHEHHDQDHEHEHHEHHLEHNHEETLEQDAAPLRSPLSNRDSNLQSNSIPNFPFNLNKQKNAISQNTIITEIASSGTNENGRKCVDKLMMVEETVWDDVMTCDHSYDTRCHISYITTYESQQEEECDENYRKVCVIDFEQKAFNESVEICNTPLVKDCNIPGPEVCRTVYESVCETRQKVHQVEDDVTNCKTEVMTKCRDVTQGYQTKQECDEWPVQRCSISKQKVNKYTPETSCHKEPREVCAPEPCSFTNGTVQCHSEMKTVVVDHPVESCDMEPVRTCRHVTKQVPKLVPKEECSDVPKEICSRTRVNPQKRKRPVIKKWCYVPTKESGLI